MSPRDEDGSLTAEEQIIAGFEDFFLSVVPIAFLSRKGLRVRSWEQRPVAGLSNQRQASIVRQVPRESNSKSPQPPLTKGARGDFV
jgi:hypothetical protein